MHFGGEPVFNYLLIAVTCGISFLGFRDSFFLDRYIFWPEAILARKEYIRLISPGFLHLDFNHLLMNMLTLYFFGPAIERGIGPAAFLVIYFAALVGGNLLPLYIHRHHDYRALGASGAVSGIVLAHIFLFPGGGIGIFFLPLYIPAWLYAVLYLGFSFRGMHLDNQLVGHDAHLGGALVGLYTAAAFRPEMILASRWWFGGITVATILLIFYLDRHPRLGPMKGFNFSRSEKAAPKRREEQRVDDLLQKISNEGLEALTAEERNFLENTSAGIRRRAERQKPRWYLPF